VPVITEIWGAVPLSDTFSKKMRPKPPSAAAPSCSRAPADSRNPTTGMRSVLANRSTRTTRSASAIPTDPPASRESCA
jgi:hypothetical protein